MIYDNINEILGKSCKTKLLFLFIKYTMQHNSCWHQHVSSFTLIHHAAKWINGQIDKTKLNHSHCQNRLKNKHYKMEKTFSKYSLIECHSNEIENWAQKQWIIGNVFDVIKINQLLARFLRVQSVVWVKNVLQYNVAMCAVTRKVAEVTRGPFYTIGRFSDHHWPESHQQGVADTLRRRKQKQKQNVDPKAQHRFCTMV